MTDADIERLARVAAAIGEVAYERCPKYWLSVARAILAEQEAIEVERRMILKREDAARRIDGMM